MGRGAERDELTGALRYPQFRVYWVGSLVSQVGMWMQTFALGWLVVQLAAADGEPARAPLYFGLLGLAAAIPSLTITLVGGAIADRVDLRRILLVTQLVLAGLAALLGTLVGGGSVTIGHVIAVAFLSSCAQAFDSPSRQAVILRLVAPRDVVSAVGLQSTSFTASQVFGPALGGFLVGPLGTGALFLIASCTFVPMLTALAFMRPMPPRSEHRPTMIASIVEGVVAVRQDAVLGWAAVYNATVSFLARPYHFLLPAFAVGIGASATEISWLLSAVGVGALAGSLILAGLGGVRRRGRLLVACVGAAGAVIVAASLQTALAGAFLVSVCFGFSLILFGGMTNTIMQLGSPEALRGRVMSVYGITITGALPLGQLAIGVAGSAFGLRMVLLAAGLAVVAAAAYGALRLPALTGSTPPPEDAPLATVSAR